MSHNPRVSLQDTATYTIDKAGNPQQHNALNDRLTHRLLEDDLYRYRYDKNGNFTTKHNKATQEDTAYSWNSFGQLIEVDEEIIYDKHYGKILNHHQTEETHNPYGYTGRETDLEDLYYYRARYYDPQTQRFLSRDPIEFEAGDFNFYRYVSNDPVNFVDPSGLEERQTWTYDSMRKAICGIVCENLTNEEIACKYTPTPTSNRKVEGQDPWKLRNLDTNTIYGKTDVDWALTLAEMSNGQSTSIPFTNYKIQPRPWTLYHVGKIVWAVTDEGGKHFKSHMSMYRDESELNAIKMANDLITNKKKFSEMFNVGDCKCK
jgi:RHS repeat-associated protein